MADQRDNKSYNIEAVRQLLLAAFTAEELRRFCFDHAAFRPIVHNFGPKYNLNDMVDEVLVYCDACALFDQLLAAVQQVNPAQYARFEDHLHEPGYSAPSTSRHRSAYQGELQIQVPETGVARFLGCKERAITLTPAQQRRNRENLLANVKATWIDGYLHHAVHHAVYMQLGIEYKRDAVSRPWDLTIEPAGRPVSPDKSLAELFAEHGRSMLILGEPASGKTITLLQLADSLLNEARHDPGCPIPAILNLSSWTRERRSLVDWLVEEMFVAYQVARFLTPAWIEANALTLLLDGLDEVKESCREACVAAINEFKADHPADIAVSCRTADYATLGNRLNLSAAICVQPLTPVQIDAYLAQFGPDLDGVRAALPDDKDLQKLAQSPLMLSLIPLTYDGAAPATMEGGSTLDDTRHSFLGAYVRRVFQHRPLPPNSPYSQPQALHWLANLARGMTRHSQSIFYIERLQPTWLPTDRASRLYGLAFGLFGGLLGGLSFGLLSGLLFGLLLSPNLVLVTGLITGELYLLVHLVLYSLLYSVFGWPHGNIALSEKLRWSRPDSLLKRIRGNLIVGLVSILLVWTLVVLLSGVAIGDLDLIPVLILLLIGVLLCGLLFGLDAHILTAQTKQHARPNQGIHSSLHNALYISSLFGLVVGLMVGLIVGLYNVLTSGLANESSARLISIMFLGLAVGLIGWVSGGLSSSPRFGLIFGLCWGLLLGLLGGRGKELSVGLFTGIVSGLLGGLSGAVTDRLRQYGGDAVVKHYALRFLLDQSNILPYPFHDRRLIAFLDAMADRILLRRMGGGWMFIHRYLLEYFASLETEETQS